VVAAFGPQCTVLSRPGCHTLSVSDRAGDPQRADLRVATPAGQASRQPIERAPHGDAASGSTYRIPLPFPSRRSHRA
jgi:hypothetical protein